MSLEASEIEEPDPSTYSISTPPSVPVQVDLTFVITEVLDVDDKKNVR